MWKWQLTIICILMSASSFAGGGYTDDTFLEITQILTVFVNGSFGSLLIYTLFICLCAGYAAGALGKRWFYPLIGLLLALKFGIPILEAVLRSSDECSVADRIKHLC